MLQVRPLLLLLSLLVLPQFVWAADSTLVLSGDEGPGKGKHVVLIAGDEEYRSEEALPMLAQILSKRYGFQCTVLFSINPETGEIDPNNQTNIPGMQALGSADLCVLFTRFRELPDDDMKHFVDYLQAGKPLIALRTSTHAFAYSRDKESPYAKFSYNRQGGFGKQVLGETWVSHHGHHGRESTRGVVNKSQADHPILQGVNDVWGPTDVYGVRELPADAKVLLYGQVLQGMEPGDQPVEGKKNDPMMPLAWILPYQLDGGEPGMAFCSTYGAATDLASEDGRRLMINAALYLCGLQDQITADSNVEPLTAYEPTPFGFGKAQKGRKPSDYKLD